MPDAMTLAFFWDSLKGVGSVLVFVLAYFLKEWRVAQKKQVKKVEQLVSDMRSLRDATQANSKAIGDMIVSHGRALEIMKEDHRETNRQFIENLKLLIDNKILVSNTS